MAEPCFKILWNETIPRHIAEGPDGARVEVAAIAGRLDVDGFGDVPAPPPRSYASSEDSDLAIWTLVFTGEGAAFTLPPARRGTNRTLYFYKGSRVTVGGKAVEGFCGMELIADLPVEVVNRGREPAEFLMLQGKPIDQPVVQHGPFVMNTQQEIREAFSDYQVLVPARACGARFVRVAGLAGAATAGQPTAPDVTVAQPRIVCFGQKDGQTRSLHEHRGMGGGVYLATLCPGDICLEERFIAQHACGL